jgi:HK97 family phage prohead protease
MSDFPRDDLIRMVSLPSAQIEFRNEQPDDENADGRLGTLQGYAAVFNEDTEIDSWEGRFVERIAPGAFKKTLSDRGDKIKVLFNHGFDPQIGDKPLGRPSIQQEDARGLYVEVPLDDTSYNKDLVASLRSGALDGMSFRFSVTRDEWDESRADMPIRTLKEVRLYEYGPVTFPAYEATEAGVRARDAYQAYRAQKISSPDAAADPGTSEEPPTTPPTVAPGVSKTERARIARSKTPLIKELTA